MKAIARNILLQHLQPNYSLTKKQRQYDRSIAEGLRLDRLAILCDFLAIVATSDAFLYLVSRITQLRDALWVSRKIPRTIPGTVIGRLIFV